MARNSGQASQAAPTSASQFAAVDVGAGVSGDSRAVILEVELADGSKKQMKRTDYIRARALEGASRATIRAEVEKISGKPCTYQTVFGATKDMVEQYPKKGTAGKADVAQGEGAAA